MIFKDREGNVWIGTSGGIVRRSSTPATMIPLPQNSAEYTNETIYCDFDGTIWITSSTKLFRIRNGIAERFRFPEYPELKVTAIFRDHARNLWIGTDGSGLFRFGEQGVKQFTKSTGLISDTVRLILEDRNGDIWIGSYGGVTRISGKSIRQFGVKGDLAYNGVTALFEDRTRDIWVGTYRGISRISKSVVVSDNAIQALAQEHVWTIDQDAEGTVWIGTSDGLYGVHEGKLVHLTAAQGLANNTIYQILHDPRGNVWLSGPNSISQLRATELDQFASGNRDRVSLANYLGSDSLWSARFCVGRQQEGIIDIHGDPWFPSTIGAIHVVGNRLAPRIPPNVAIH